MKSSVMRCVGAAYVAAAAVLSAMGAAHEQTAYFLAAIALTLPLGAAAAVSIYAGYALLEAVGGLFAPPTRADGSEAAWLSGASAALDVAVLCGAALGNVVLLHRLRRRRRPAGADG